MSDTQTTKPKEILTPGNRVFARAVLKGDLPAYKAYKVAYPNASDATAMVQSSDLLHTPKITNYIESLLDKAGLTQEVLLDKVKDIVVSTKEVTDIDGPEGHTVITKPARATDKLKAIDLLNKMSGLYDRNKASADIAVKRYAQLSRELLRAVGKPQVGITDTDYTIKAELDSDITEQIDSAEYVDRFSIDTTDTVEGNAEGG